MKAVKIKIPKWNKAEITIDQTYIRAVWLDIARNGTRESTLYIPIRQTKAMIKALQQALKVAQRNKHP